MTVSHHRPQRGASPRIREVPRVLVNQYTFDRDTEIARYGEKGMVRCSTT